MAQQTRLDMFDLQRLPQQSVGLEIDLADRKIVRCMPIFVHAGELGL